MLDRPTVPSGTPLTGSGGEPLDLDTTDDPIELFGRWFDAALERGIELPEAVALATATPDAHPSVRMVLLKDADEHGFTFFTNYESRKAEELEANPRAALCFHWKELDRQVRVTGAVTRISDEESYRYFVTRPEGSRIGAWASKQSRPLASRAELEARVAELEQRFEGRDIPLPPFWGGYRLQPDRIEFWQGRPDRLHDRIGFDRAEDGWQAVRLYP
ncbi:MAG: pyridoxamine 5'-phosphate oxidase [Gemmatimonadota bacterium]